MANSQTIQITLKAVSDFSDIMTNVKKVQGVVDQLKLPDSLKGSFVKAFSEIEVATEKASKAMASGFKTKGDVAAFENAMQTINSLLRTMGINLSKISDADLARSINIDTTQVEAATKRLQDLQTELTKTINAAGNLDQIDDAFKRLQANGAKGTSSVDKFLKAFKSGDIEEAKKHLENFTIVVEENLDTKHGEQLYEMWERLTNLIANVDVGKIQQLGVEMEEAKEQMKGFDPAELEKMKQVVGDLVQRMFPQFIQGAKGAGEAIADGGKKAQRFNSELDQIKHRIAHFFGLANAVNLFKRAVRSAFETVKDLDKIMTETAVVTNFSVGDMWEQLPEYTRRANELGVSIHGAYEAATLFYQQGLKTNEVMAVSNETLKMARIAGLDAAEATDRMTNALRGFNMAIDEASAKNINDVYSNLAAKTASDVDEISTAMTKVASLAHNANMSFENTAAFLSQIIETTRESAETAGTALKTVIARFSEVKNLYSTGDLLGKDANGDEIDVNKVSKALRSAGINLNEYLTGMKGLDDIFMELSAKWDSLDQVQQRYIATMAAGSRQQSRFIALMQDNARMTELVREANNSAGASQEQFDKTLESLESKLNRLKNSWDSFLMSLANSSAIKTIVDILNELLTIINKMTDSLPGLLGSFTRITTLIVAFKVGRNIFNKLFASIGSALKQGTTKINAQLQSDAKQSGKKTATTWIDSFRSNLKKNGGKGLFTSFFTESFDVKDTSQFTKSFAKDFVKNTDKALQNLNMSLQNRKEIYVAFKEEGYDGMIAKMRAFKMTEDQISEATKNLDQQTKDYTATTQKTALDLGNVGMAFMAVGGAISMLSQAFDDGSESGQKMAKVFRTMGSVLMGVGSACTALNGIINIFGLKITKAGIMAASAGTGATLAWGPFIAIAAAIVVAIGAVVLAFKAVEAHSPEAKLEKAKEAAQAAAEAADEAAEAYKNLGDAFESLEDKYNKFEELEKGTQKWKDAIYEVNQQVLDLIDKYPELQTLVSLDPNKGYLVLDLNSQSAQAILDQYRTASLEQEAYAANKQRDVFQSSIDVAYANLSEDTRGYFNVVGASGNTISRKLLEDLAEQIFLGTIEKQQNETYSQAIQRYAKSLGLVLELTDEQIKELKGFGSTIHVAKSNIESADFIQAQKIAASKGLDQEETNLLANYINGIGDIIQKESQAIYDANEKHGGTQYQNDANYLDWLRKTYGASAHVTDEWGAFEYTGSSGQVVKVDKDRARKEYAYHRALVEEVDNAVMQNIEQILKANGVLKKIYTAEGGTKLTGQDLDKLNIGSGTTAQDLINNNDFKNKIANELGIDASLFSQERYKVVLQKAAEDVVFGYANYIEQSSKTALAELNKEYFDSEQLKKLSGPLSKTLATFGQGAANDMAENINKITKELDEPGEIDAFVEGLNRLDLTDPTTIENFEQQLMGLGVDINYGSAAFEQLKKSLIEVANAAKTVDLQKIKEDVNNLGKIEEKVAKGSNLSKEEFDLLKASGIDVSDFREVNGEYVYLGNNIEGLTSAIKGLIKELSGEGKDYIEQKRRTREVLKNGKLTPEQLREAAREGGVHSAGGGAGLILGKNGKISSIIVQDIVDGLILGGKENDQEAEKIGEALKKTDLTNYTLQSDEVKKLYLKGLLEALTADETELSDLGLGFGEGVKIDDILNSGAEQISIYLGQIKALYDEEDLESEEENLEFNEKLQETIGQLLEDAYYGDEEAKHALTHKFQGEAGELGVDKIQFNAYTAELQQQNPLLQENEILAQRVALANIKLNSGLSDIISSYKDWTGLIDESTGLIKVNSVEDIAAFNKLKDSVQKMLNASKPLSDAFWNDKSNIKALKAAAEGEVEALEKLQRASTADYLQNTQLEVNTEEAKQGITDFINYLNDFDLNYEVGFTFDGKDEIVSKFNDMVKAANLSADQITEAAQRMGFSAEIEYANEDRYVTGIRTERVITGRDEATGEITSWEEVVSPTEPKLIKGWFPVVKTLTSNGSGGGGVSVKNVEAGKGNKPSTSSSGSSGSSSKPSYWKNPYDELFNLQEEINETLRDREELERRYQRLLKSETTTIDQIRQSYRDQIAMMQQQIELQRQLAAGRLRQIENLGNQYYTDSEGNRRTYASLGVTQYAHYNAETGEFTIDWDRLEQIANDAGRTAEGEAAEAYINALQELINSYEETRNAIWEIEDAIEDLNNELVESYMSFEDRVMDALVASYEREIESLEKINDAINDATSKVLDGIQKEIDAQRQERENAKTEQEIADKEARLAYLRLDTSGANSLEIMQLEKELEDARENYEDTLIDQALEQMREDADLAAEQRAQQIQLMREQLQQWKDNGELWPQVYELIANAWDGEGHLNANSDLVALLKSEEGFAGLSEIGQQKWWDDYVEAANTFISSIDGVVAKYWDQLSPWLQAILTELGANPEPVQIPPVSGGGSGNGGGSSGGGSSGGNTGSGGSNSGSGGSTLGSIGIDPNSIDPENYPYGKASSTTGVLQEGHHGAPVGAVVWALAKMGYLKNVRVNGTNFITNLPNFDPFDFNDKVKEAVINYQKARGISADGKVGNGTRNKFRIDRYKTGGLADFTGPAWLDGTKSHPEMVLNARDTENLITLKNILASLMTPDSQTNKTFGDAYFDIDINADISSDYDVDQLADRIKQQIVQDARYRNINMVNFMR